MKLSAKKSYSIALGALLLPLGLAACSSSASTFEAESYQDSSLSSVKTRINDLSSTNAKVKAYDTTGANRPITNETEWKVCTQNVKPGDSIQNATVVEVGVTRADEECIETGYQEELNKPTTPVELDPQDGGEPDKPGGKNTTVKPKDPSGPGTYKLDDVRGQDASKFVEELKSQPGFAGTLFVWDKTADQEVNPKPGQKVCETSPVAGSELEFGSNFRMIVFVNC